MEIKFSKEDKERLIYKIKDYFEAELDFEIGGFDAEFLLDFFAKEMGHVFYNQALSDVQMQVDQQFDTLKDAIYDLEKSE